MYLCSDDYIYHTIYNIHCILYNVHIFVVASSGEIFPIEIKKLKGDRLYIF